MKKIAVGLAASLFLAAGATIARAADWCFMPNDLSEYRALDFRMPAPGKCSAPFTYFLRAFNGPHGMQATGEVGVGVACTSSEKALGSNRVSVRLMAGSHTHHITAFHRSAGGFMSTCHDGYCTGNDSLYGSGPCTEKHPFDR